MSQTPNPKQLFRFSIISQVIARTERGQRRSEAVTDAAASSHIDPSGRQVRVSARSVYRWLAMFEEHGIAGLADPPRLRSSDRIPKTLLDFLRSERRRDSDASIPELLHRAILHGMTTAESAPHRATVHRALVRHGLSTQRATKTRGRDTRRFAYPHRMDMVLCDGKHFRAGAKRVRRVAMSYLDDATRKVLHVVVGPSESAELFLRGLYECILKHGLMSVIYLDRGPGYIANATQFVAARLGVHLVLGEVAYPQGHGKVERYHRTLTADLLRLLDKNHDVDPAIPALELRLRHYVDDVYAHRPHGGLSGDSPHKRFFETDKKPLRFRGEDKLRPAFAIEHNRRVSNDHVVSFDGVSYEMPKGTASKRVVLRQQILDGKVYFEHEGRLIRLEPVDLHKNARDPRDRRDSIDGHGEHRGDTQSAADLRFQDEFPPVVDRDGGCHEVEGDPDLSHDFFNHDDDDDDFVGA